MLPLSLVRAESGHNGASGRQGLCFRAKSDGHTDGQRGCLSRDQSRERTALGSKGTDLGEVTVAGEVTAEAMLPLEICVCPFLILPPKNLPGDLIT